MTTKFLMSTISPRVSLAFFNSCQHTKLLLLLLRCSAAATSALAILHHYAGDYSGLYSSIQISCVRELVVHERALDRERGLASEERSFKFCLVCVYLVMYVYEGGEKMFDDGCASLRR